MANLKAEQIITNAVDSGFYAYFSKYKPRYNELANLTKDNGCVTCIEIDTSALNIVKSAVAKSVNAELKRKNNIRVKVPILNAVNNDLLVSMGPKLNYDFTLISNVGCDYKNTYKSVGINNTLHQIIITVTTSYYIDIPRQKIKKTYVTSYLLAQTVVIGKVPESFTSVYDYNEDLTDKVIDYKN